MTPEELEAKWLTRLLLARSRDEFLYVTHEEFGELGKELSHLLWGTPVLIDAEKREAQVNSEHSD